jgi:transcriptional regulator with XRE-family HTH domain
MAKRAIPEEQRLVGARIAQARQASGLTQRALAAELSVTTRTVINYESGVTIPYKHLQKIAELTHTRREWLLHGSAPTEFGETLDRLDRAMQKHRALVETQADMLRTQAGLLRERGELTP